MPNFPVIPRAMADAMRTNRRPAELMMLPTDWNPDLMPERAVLQIKYDGIHAGWHEEWPGFSREGVDFAAMSHLSQDMRAIDAALGGRHVLFGEYLHQDGFDATLADFARRRGTGIVMLFDAVPLDVWEGRAPSAPLHERLQMLCAAMGKAQPPQVGFASGSLFIGEERDNIEVAVGTWWEDGHEGGVVKDADSPYVRARSPHWQRIKRKVTLDLPIVGRTTSLKGQLVSFDVSPREGITARIGTGIAKWLRAVPDMFRPGRVVEIEHSGFTKRGSLRHPTFLRFRDDKES